MENRSIIIRDDRNTARSYYPHQQQAFECLDLLNHEKDSFSTLLVLPTGGGKTLTACTWLLRNAIEKNKKVLWIAHRTFLLDQAEEEFRKESMKTNLSFKSSYYYRIICGDHSSNDGFIQHDYAYNIQNDDQLLLVSKDSIRREENLHYLDIWLEDLDELFVVIDEAHHSIAKTYRNIIKHIKQRSPYLRLKVIGLTATPTRTNEKEQGLLKVLFPDGILNGKVQDNGIVYKIDLQKLIVEHILATPILDSVVTSQNYGSEIGLEEMDKINRLDILPERVMRRIASDSVRNELIVDTYVKNKEKYGKTIVFALNQLQAASLSEFFKQRGIKADFVVSGMRAEYTGATISPAENKKRLESYRNGDLDVLVNVNILTEGVDVPQTKTVFLTRPTISKILMTQMVGRALRGTAAEGTEDAYIVSFFDNWENKIAWVNPASVFESNGIFDDRKQESIKRKIEIISVSKIAEFVKLMHNSLYKKQIAPIPYIERIPVGFYIFSYDIDTEDCETIDKNCQIIVYHDKQDLYKNFIEVGLERFFVTEGLMNIETLDNDTLERLKDKCIDEYFKDIHLEDFEKEGIEDVLRYYAEKGIVPTFYPLGEEYRKKLDISVIAQEVVNQRMNIIEQQKYVDKKWQEEEELFKMYFKDMVYYLDAIDLEINKLLRPQLYGIAENNISKRRLEEEEMDMKTLKSQHPQKYYELKDAVFESNKKRTMLEYDTEDEVYSCERCKKKSSNRADFQIDHIKPMIRGGRTILSNLQLLCKHCNGLKGSDYFDEQLSNYNEEV